MAPDDLLEQNEWDTVPRSPEGQPQITVRPPPPPGTPEGIKQPEFSDGPWPYDVAQARAGKAPEPPEAPPEEPELGPVPYEEIAKKISGKRNDPPPPPQPTVQEMARSNWDLFKRGLTEAPLAQLQSMNEALDRRYYPPQAAFIGDDGTFYDKDHKPIHDQYKPTLLPATVNPDTKAIEPAMPGALDLIHTIGSPVRGAATLGAGFVPPGMGHNMPPPGALPHVPPGGVPPHVAPPAAVPPAGPRRIISGFDDKEPVTFDRVYTRTIDDLNPLNILEKQLAQHGALAPDEQFYQLARLTRGSFGRSHQAIQNSTFDFATGANNGKGLKPILAPVAKDLKAFEEYAVAARDVELLGRGFKTGDTLANAQAKVAAAPPEFRNALKELHGYQDRVLQYLRDSGVMSGTDYNVIKALNKAYVPFHRAMDNADMFTSNKNIKSWNPIKKVQGSERDILSPIETIIRNTHMFIDLAEKNRALTALVKAGENRALSGLVTKAPRQMHPINVTRDEVENFLTGSGITMPPGFNGAPDSFTIFRPNSFRPAPDEIAVFKNGKRQIYKVDPEVANAVNGMGSQEVDLVTRVLSTPARMLRAGATLSPEFLVKNPARDQLAAMIFSKNGYLPVLDYVRGLGHMLGNSPKYQNWLKSGGANSSLVSLDRRYIAEEIKNLKNSGVLGTIKNVIDPRQILTNLSKISEYGEQPTRIGEFIKAMNKGKSAHQAGFESREVTVDFGRRGSSKTLEHLARTTAFFNPQVQGIDRLARAFKEAPAATSFKIAAGITLPTLGAYAYNRQDPRMMSIPRWERDLYWHVPTDSWQEYKPVDPKKAQDEIRQIPETFKKTVEGKTYVNYGTIYRVPKPFEVGTTFGSSLERVLDSYFAKDPEAFKGFAKTMRSSWLPGIVPQWLQPGIETAANYNFFRDTPIVPKRLETPEHRKYEYGPYTTETAKFIGSAISNISPDSRATSPMIIENAILGWSGTLGRYALEIADKAIGLFGGPKKVSPEKGEADIPLWKAIVTRMPTTAAADISDFYDNLQKTTSNRSLIKRLSNERAPLGKEETPEEKQSRISPAKQIQNESVTMKMEKAAIAIGRQFDMIRKVQDAPNMTPADKKKTIELLTFGALSMAQQTNKAYYEAQKRLQQ